MHSSTAHVPHLHTNFILTPLNILIIFCEEYKLRRSPSVFSLSSCDILCLWSHSSYRSLFSDTTNLPLWQEIKFQAHIKQRLKLKANRVIFLAFRQKPEIISILNRVASKIQSSRNCSAAPLWQPGIFILISSWIIIPRYFKYPLPPFP